MSEDTKIQWCSSTWSPWLGCSKVSPGCKFCYITTTTPFRVKNIKHGDPRQRTSVSYWKQAMQWNQKAVCGKCGALEFLGSDDCRHCQQNFSIQIRPRIFPSLCDWLDDEVPIEWLADFLKLIHDTPNLDWLLLSKRPENFLPRLESVATRWALDNELGNWICGWLAESPPENVWIGTSVENQEYADKRIPELLKIPAKVRFLSVEPMLGPVEFSDVGKRSDAVKQLGKQALDGVHWCIVGGESGKGARPCNIEWIRSIVAQCKAAGVPCFVKQLGGNLSDQDSDECSRSSGRSMHHPKGGDPAEWSPDLRVREFPKI